MSGLGVPRARAVFIDDREENIKAAVEAGLQVVLFQTTGQALRDATELCGVNV